MTHIVGPGEDPNERLVIRTDVVLGSTMNVDNGDATPILFWQVTSRSLGEVSEVETHVFGMTRDQAFYNAGQLALRASELPEGSGR